MKVQSIVGSFVIVLGNFVLHMTLAILASQIQVPEQADIDQEEGNLLEVGDYECPSAEELEWSVTYCMTCHIIATTVLLYLELHENVLGRILFWCRERKFCCYKESQTLILTQKQIQSIRLLPELDEHRGHGGAL